METAGEDRGGNIFLPWAPYGRGLVPSHFSLARPEMVGASLVDSNVLLVCASSPLLSPQVQQPLQRVSAPAAHQLFFVFHIHADYALVHQQLEGVTEVLHHGPPADLNQGLNRIDVSLVCDIGDDPHWQDNFWTPWTSGIQLHPSFYSPALKQSLGVL